MTAWSLATATSSSGRWVYARIHADGQLVGNVTVTREQYNDLAERLTRDWQAALEQLRVERDECLDLATKMRIERDQARLDVERKRHALADAVALGAQMADWRRAFVEEFQPVELPAVDFGPAHPDGPAIPDLAPEAGERTEDAPGGDV
jgi:hypothetical protein